MIKITTLILLGLSLAGWVNPGWCASTSSQSFTVSATIPAAVQSNIATFAIATEQIAVRNNKTVIVRSIVLP